MVHLLTEVDAFGPKVTSLITSTSIASSRDSDLRLSPSTTTKVTFERLISASSGFCIMRSTQKSSEKVLFRNCHESITTVHTIRANLSAGREIRFASLCFPKGYPIVFSARPYICILVDIVARKPEPRLFCNA